MKVVCKREEKTMKTMWYVIDSVNFDGSIPTYPSGIFETKEEANEYAKTYKFWHGVDPEVIELVVPTPIMPIPENVIVHVSTYNDFHGEWGKHIGAFFRKEMATGQEINRVYHDSQVNARTDYEVCVMVSTKDKTEKQIREEGIEKAKALFKQYGLNF